MKTIANHHIFKNIKNYYTKCGYRYKSYVAENNSRGLEFNNRVETFKVEFPEDEDFYQTIVYAATKVKPEYKFHSLFSKELPQESLIIKMINAAKTRNDADWLNFVEHEPALKYL